MTLKCHCRDCQLSSGGPFVSVVMLPGESVKLLQGSLRYYSSLSSAGGSIHRGFCAECGSPVLAKFDPAPHLTGIRAGSLDDASWFRPSADMWSSDAQPWDHMDPSLPKFEQYSVSSACVC